MRQRITVAEVLMPIALGIVLLWPFWSFRFVLPLAPFLFYYGTAGTLLIANAAAAALRARWLDPPRVARIALLAIIGLNVFDHLSYIVQYRGPMARTRDTARAAARPSGIEWIADARDVEQVLEWMNRQLKEPGPVATTNPALVYLRTGRKTLSLDVVPADWREWRQRGVRYVVCLLPADLPPGDYKLLYKSPKRLWVIEL